MTDTKIERQGVSERGGVEIQENLDTFEVLEELNDFDSVLQSMKKSATWKSRCLRQVMQTILGHLRSRTCIKTRECTYTQARAHNHARAHTHRTQARLRAEEREEESWVCDRSCFSRIVQIFKSWLKSIPLCSNRTRERKCVYVWMTERVSEWIRKKRYEIQE